MKKSAKSLVCKNQQSGAQNFVQKFLFNLLDFCCSQLLKKGADAEIYPEYGKTEVQILFEPLEFADSSMEFSKKSEDKKLPNTLRLLAFSAIHL